MGNWWHTGGDPSAVKPAAIKTAPSAFSIYLVPDAWPMGTRCVIEVEFVRRETTSCARPYRRAVDADDDIWNGAK